MCRCHRGCPEVKGLFVRVESLLSPHGFWRSDSGHQAGQLLYPLNCLPDPWALLYNGREQLHMLLISSVCDGVYDFLQRAYVAKESLAYKTELGWRED